MDAGYLGSVENARSRTISHVQGVRLSEDLGDVKVDAKERLKNRELRW